MIDPGHLVRLMRDIPVRELVRAEEDLSDLGCSDESLALLGGSPCVCR